MKSPAAEWVLGIGYLAVLDGIRAHGEADEDTLSEVVRGYVARHPSGQRIFATVLLAGGIGLYRHIVNPINKEKS